MKKPKKLYILLIAAICAAASLSSCSALMGVKPQPNNNYYTK